MCPLLNAWAACLILSKRARPFSGTELFNQPEAQPRAKCGFDYGGDKENSVNNPVHSGEKGTYRHSAHSACQRKRQTCRHPRAEKQHTYGARGRRYDKTRAQPRKSRRQAGLFFIYYKIRRNQRGRQRYFREKICSSAVELLQMQKRGYRLCYPLRDPLR